jgi:Zn-dependent alcohol dehydrogenase
MLLSDTAHGTDSDLQNSQEVNTEQLVLLIDVSPSMSIKDAGKTGELTRRERIGDVVSSLLDRMGRQVRYTVICFYTKSVHIAKMAHDKLIVKNVFNDLPVEITMKPGKTDLGAAVKDTLDFINDYSKGSVTLMICTDGDTVPATVAISKTDSIGNALVLGVGNVKRGTPIDNHISRQDSIVLNRLSQQLHGNYLNVNTKNIPSAVIADLCDSGTLAAASKIGKTRLYTIWLVLFSAVYAFMPVALEFLGSDWKVVGRG